MTAPAACAPTVERRSGERYPWRAVCPCGWASIGYVREHAAQIMADDHGAGQPAG